MKKSQKLGWILNGLTCLVWAAIGLYEHWPWYIILMPVWVILGLILLVVLIVLPALIDEE